MTRTCYPQREHGTVAGQAMKTMLSKRLGMATDQKQIPIPTDPWEFIQQCVWTYDELHPGATGDPLRKFPTKEHLRILTREWQAHGNIHVKKSSQIMVTWLFAALYLHRALMQRGTRVAWFCQTRPDALDHIESRAYRIYQHIPARYVKPDVAMTDEGLLVYHDGLKTLPTAWLTPMAAETDRRDNAAKKMRSRTWTDSYFDEAEFYPNQSELIHSTMPRSRRMTLVSTPNGDTYVNRLGYSTRLEDPIAPLDKPEKEPMARGIEAWNRHGFRHVEVHYSSDPDKDTATPAGAAWYQHEYNRTPDKLKWRREMELDSSVAAGVPVFADVERIVFAPQSYRPHLPLYCGRDFQFSCPVAVFFQVDNPDGDLPIVRLLLEVRMVNMTLESFERNYVAPQRQKYFGSAEVVEFGDPAGEQRRDVSAMSSIAILAAMGRIVRHRITKVDARLAKLQAIITGNGLHIDPTTCSGIGRDLRGGYYRDSHGRPCKDGVHDHGPDALGYAVDCLFEFADPNAGGALVFRPEGLEDVQTGLSADGSVWVPTAEDERRDGKR